MMHNMVQKGKHKRGFKQLIRGFHIFKSPSISFMPNIQQRHRGAANQAFFCFFLT